jgi:hypothetical protein
MMRKDEEESRAKSSSTTPNLQIDFSKYQTFIEEVVSGEYYNK